MIKEKNDDFLTTVSVIKDDRDITYRINYVDNEKSISSDNIITADILSEQCVKTFFQGKIVQIRYVKSIIAKSKNVEFVEVKNDKNGILHIFSENIERDFPDLVEKINLCRQDSYQKIVEEANYRGKINSIIFALEQTEKTTSIKIEQKENGKQIICYIPFKKVNGKSEISSNDINMIQNIINFYISLIGNNPMSVYSNGFDGYLTDTKIYTKSGQIEIHGNTLIKELMLYLSVLMRDIDSKDKGKKRVKVVFFNE